MLSKSPAIEHFRPAAFSRARWARLAGLSVLALGGLVLAVPGVHATTPAATIATDHAILSDGIVALGVRDPGILSVDGNGTEAWAVSRNCRASTGAAIAPTEVTLRLILTNDEGMDCDFEGEGWALSYLDESGARIEGRARSEAVVNLAVATTVRTVLEGTIHPVRFEADDVGLAQEHRWARAVTDVGSLRITQEFQPRSDTPMAYDDRITLENRGTEVMQDIRYTRAMSFGSSVHGDDCVFMTAATLPNGSPPPREVLGIGHGALDPWTAKPGNTLIPPNYGYFDTGPADQGSTWSLSLGHLAPGQVNNFTLVFGVGLGKDDAMSTLATIHGQVYSLAVANAGGYGDCYLAMHERPPPPEVPAPQFPTFFIAFTGLNTAASPVHAEFAFMAPTECDAREVAFRDAGSTVAWGNITSRLYDFGDGTQAPGPNALHTFPQPGHTYLVTYTVIDQHGTRAVATQSVVAPDGDCPPHLDPIPDQIIRLGDAIDPPCFHAQDPDDTEKQLNWHYKGVPPGARVTADRCLVWKPSVDQVGSWKVDVEVCDRRACDHQEFWITVWTVPPPGGPAGCGDADHDGVCDSADDCPGVPDHGQRDWDQDGLGDACEAIGRSAVASPAAPAPWSSPQDRDRDGVADSADDCVVTPNRDQADLDGDGVGDACDDDVDGDGVANWVAGGSAFLDNCPRVANPDQQDHDHDGTGDACATATKTRAKGPIAAAVAAQPPGLPSDPLRILIWMGVGIGAAAAAFVAGRRRAGATILFSRLAGQDLLKHRARAAIVGIVEAQPGIHFSQLSRVSGLGQGALRHHLDVLRKAGLLRARPSGRFECYFAAASHAPGGELTEQAAGALKAAAARAVLRHALAEPGSTLAQTARALGIHYRSAAHHAERLARAGLVALHDPAQGRGVVLTPEPSARSLPPEAVAADPRTLPSDAGEGRHARRGGRRSYQNWSVCLAQYNPVRNPTMAPPLSRGRPACGLPFSTKPIRTA